MDSVKFMMGLLDKTPHRDEKFRQNENVAIFSYKFLCVDAKLLGKLNFLSCQKKINGNKKHVSQN